MKLKIAVLSVVVVAHLAVPLAVNGGFCEPENPDYLCGYQCDGWGCVTGPGVAPTDACVWVYDGSTACYTVYDADECSSCSGF